MIVDAHHHFWRAGRSEHDWHALGLDLLHRDFAPDHLKPLLVDAGVDATVVVHSAHTSADTVELLRLAADTPFVAGVVGWVPLAGSTQARRALDRLAADPLLVGVRHLIDVEPDPDWLGRAEVVAALGVVAEHGLAFDVAPVTPRHLEQVGALAGRIPQLRIVVDHLGRPPLVERGWEPWASLLAEAAAHPNVATKVSAGLDVVSRWDAWRIDDLEPYLEHALRCFGPDRLMAASNWPVVLLSGDYATVWHQLRRGLAELPAAAQHAILGGTAARWYRLS